MRNQFVLLKIQTDPARHRAAEEALSLILAAAAQAEAVVAASVEAVVLVAAEAVAVEQDMVVAAERLGVAVVTVAASGPAQS